MHLSRTDKTVDMVVKAAFPDYNGNKIQSDVRDSVEMYNTQWDSGSKRDYVIIQLSTMRAINLGDCPHGMIDNRTIKIERGYLVVTRQYSGTNIYIYIYHHPEDITPSLTVKEELSKNEKIVLSATRGYKSSYAGNSDYRFYEANRQTKILRNEWNVAKESMIQKGYLNKAGAITISGKNIIGNVDLYQLKD